MATPFTRILQRHRLTSVTNTPSYDQMPGTVKHAIKCLLLCDHWLYGRTTAERHRSVRRLGHNLYDEVRPVALPDPVTIAFDDLSQVERHLNLLLDYSIDDPDSLAAWLVECSRFTEAVSERISRDMIAFSCNTEDVEAKRRHDFDQQQLMPMLQRYRARLDRRFYDSPHRPDLPPFYAELIKRTAAAIEIHRDENIPIEAQTKSLVNDYFALTGKMTVTWKGEEKTLQQMDSHLRSSDRDERQQAWELIQSRRLRDSEAIDNIMDQLVSLRHKIAQNAGFDNHRDYMFKKLCRDYTPDDCYRFRDAVQKHVVPLCDALAQTHKRELGIETYRPWDVDAAPLNQSPLRPFETTSELIAKSVKVLDQVDPGFGQMLQGMADQGCLDLDTRRGKRPGGFCSSLPVSRTSFIFANFSNTQSAVRTLVHESGHAVHNLLALPLPLIDYRHAPSEAAELASMSMELLTMPGWDQFYSDPEDLRRAQKEQLEGIVEFLPWALTVDSFQHWIYLNSQAGREARNQEFASISRSLAYHWVDWTGFEEELRHRWKAQLHIFAYPFYYIEYAIAQLGALQVYRLFRKDRAAAVEGYKRALSLGSSVPLADVYAAAGIVFDFSDQTIGELMAFVQDELASLE
jgi:oligoendopeptidase F